MTTMLPSTAFKEKSPEPLFGATLPPASAELLQARIKDLRLHLKGTPLERFINQLYEELKAKGLVLTPECYLSDQWGCPSGVPVIGVPFYLANPNLLKIEDELGGGVESEREIMMYLRHEAGHAFNYAYRLFDTEAWRKHFGDYSRPYVETYKPQPFSRKYVVHISGWYAQKHPDEDFAETFAVWLTPGSNWRERYRGWGALKKLEYVEQVATSVGTTLPAAMLLEKDLEVTEMEETVLDHYRQRMLDEKVDLHIGDHLDEDLMTLFDSADLGDTPADTFVRAERQNLIHAVTQYSGVSRAVVKSVLDHLLDRTTELKLSVRRDSSREYMTRLTSLLTALAMNYLYTDRFFEVD